MKPFRVAVNGTIALLYALVYMLSYIYFLNYHFDYLGFALLPRDGAFLLLSLIFCILPILAYRGLRAVSSIMAVFTYVLLYVPIILTFALGSSRSIPEIVGVQFTFMICMGLLFAADAIIVRSPFKLESTFDLTRGVFVLTVAATLFLVVVYRGSLKFVSFADVYLQRTANADVGQGIIPRYVATWLYTVLIPLCLAYGLVARKISYIAAGTAACLVLYMATAAKAAIVLPILYGAVFFLLAGNRVSDIYPLLVGSLTAAMCLLLTVRDTGSVEFQLSSLVLMRTIGTGGHLTRIYHEFFLSHPHTLYTHVSIVGMLTGAYPYGSLQIGQVVGQYYFSWDMNANANFWATDGIAALGLVGVPFVSILCVGVFAAMNSLTRNYDALFVLLCFLPFLVSLFNTSLFSSIWSGGGFPLMLFFLLNRRTPIIMRRTEGS